MAVHVLAVMDVVKTAFRHRRRLLVVLADVAVTTVAYTCAHLIRFDGYIPTQAFIVLLTALPVLVIIRVTAFAAFGLYRGVWTYASIRDLVSVIKAVSAGSVVFAVLLLFLGFRGHSRSILVIDWLLAVLLVGGVRLSIRLLRGGVRWRSPGARPVLIIGAGAAGAGVARELLRNANAGYYPEGFLDDDPARRGMRIDGVPVLGTINEVGPISRSREIEEVIIAIPSADRRAMRRIVERCREATLTMNIMPGLEALLTGRTRVSEIRGVRLDDLLRRAPVRLDPSTIRRALRGRRTLVTGAGGSIGSEICRQLSAVEPELLVLLDRHEAGLFEIEAELAAAYPGAARALALVDIKHRHQLEEVFARHRPEVVFDAAAYKHVPFMEAHPDEAVLNNVTGTRQLVEAALTHDVRTFVLISTDKAVNPSSVMGATKRVAERYVEAVAEHPMANGSLFCAVRFGNVLGSSGSVVPLFQRQIEQGGPITITHPDVTRYFMTIPEAVQLVLRASTLAAGGEIFVLDMGEPVRIAEMARDLARLSGLEPGRDIEFVYTGLRPGEKLTEDLWTASEDVEPTAQERLLVIRRPEAEAASLPRLVAQMETLEQLARVGDVERLIQTLRRVVPEYEPAELVSRA